MQIVWRFSRFIAGIIVLLSFSACSFFSPVELGTVNSVDIERDSQNGFAVTVTISVTNPNVIDYKIISADIDVYLEQIKLGKIDMAEPVVLPAGDSTTVKFKVALAKGNMLFTGMAVFKEIADRKAMVTLKGDAEYKALWMNKKVNVDYKKEATF